MDNKIENKQNQAAAAHSSNTGEFNFELWAKQVRPQLLASLHKRGMRY